MRRIMNKFRRILSRISDEACLKIAYFGSISPKSPNAGGSLPGSHLDLMNTECANSGAETIFGQWGGGRAKPGTANLDRVFVPELSVFSKFSYCQNMY